MTDAQKSFNAAMVKFQRSAPLLAKNAEVKYSGTHYRHAKLDEMLAALKGPLADCGLYVRWRYGEADRGVRVSCIVAHVDGHWEESTLVVPTDDGARMNPAQRIGSATTYARRYTLEAVLGLATTEDDDAQAAYPINPPLNEQRKAAERVKGEIRKMGSDTPGLSGGHPVTHGKGGAATAGAIERASLARLRADPAAPAAMVEAIDKALAERMLSLDKARRLIARAEERLAGGAE